MADELISADVWTISDSSMVAEERRDVGAGRVVRQGCRPVLEEGGDDDGGSFQPLIAAMARALSASVLAGDATSIALSLWVTLHGLVTLELAGALDTAAAEATFRSTVLAALRGWTTPALFAALRRDGDQALSERCQAAS